MRAPQPLFDQAAARPQQYIAKRRGRSSVKLLGLIACLSCLSSAHESLARGSAPEVIEQALDPYLTHVNYRDEAERVEVSAGSAEVWILESLEQGDLAKKICDGARWLFSGRLKRSAGAREAFMKLPELRELSLIFYKLKTKVNPNLEGRYVQLRSPVSAARFTLSRQRALSINTERVLLMLQGPQCQAQASELLDDLWISPEVAKSRAALEALQAQKRQAKQAPQAQPSAPRAPSP